MYWGWIMAEQPSQEEREHAWHTVSGCFINLARLGHGEYGRRLLATCIGLLRADENTPSPWPKQPGYIPEPLAGYLAEILEGALAAASKSAVSDAMHITRPAHRPQSGYSEARLWCVAWIKKKARAIGARNLPENSALSKELAEALSIETEFDIDDRTIRRWVDKDRTEAITFLCFENSDEDLPDFIKNHTFYGL